MKTYSQFTTEGNLRKWFKGSKSKDGKPGWVEVISGEPCAREEGEEDETPKCVSSDKRASMTKSERISAQRRKSAADPNQPKKSGAAKPTYVPTDKPKKKMNEEKDIKGKGSGEKDACYRKVKSRYSVWPSAYASGALVKCRKVGAANWGNTSEDFAPRTLKTYSEFIAEAEQTLRMMSLKHGTSSDAAKEIKKSGFKGDETHAATHTKTAIGFGKRYDENPSVVTMLVPKKSIKNQPEKGAKAVKTQGQRGTDALGRKHYSVAMDPEYASKKIVNRSGRVQKPKVPKRFRQDILNTQK